MKAYLSESKGKVSKSRVLCSCVLLSLLSLCFPSYSQANPNIAVFPYANVHSRPIQGFVTWGGPNHARYYRIINNEITTQDNYIWNFSRVFYTLPNGETQSWFESGQVS